MLLSVIIPLYNCGSYVERCIKSVYSQGLSESDFEVIVVDDGSTDDGSERVAREAERRDNLRLVVQTNQGVSSARNRGLRLAQGRYVQFVDADDFLKPCYIGGLLKMAVDNNLDIITFRSITVGETDMPPTVPDSHGQFPLPEVITGIEAERRAPQSSFLYNCYNYIARRSLYEESGLKFDTSLSYGEDGLLSMQLFFNAHRVMVTDYEVYCYVRRADSTCHIRGGEGELRRVRNYRLSAQRFHEVNEAYRERSREGYTMLRQRINLFLFFYLYGSMKCGLTTSELRAGISELMRDGLYPIGTFDDFGYRGLKHRLLRHFANMGSLFTTAHCLVNLFRRLGSLGKRP